MQCPKCNSDNTQRLEVVYHGGTQDINTTGATVGGAHGGGIFGLGGAVTKTTGQSQSILAQKAAPPSKKPYKWGSIFLLVGTVLLSGPTGILLTGIGFIALGGYMVYSAYQFNSKEWPTLHQCWLDSWLCNKCGTTYQHI